MNTPPAMVPIAPQYAACKCCGFAAPLFGVVDFSKNCEDRRQPPKPLSGIPVYYFGCPQCEMVFTNSFDHFTRDDFTTHIYNAGYAEVDPDFELVRPKDMATRVAGAFAGSPHISILDYGGGNGMLAASLRAHGFSDVTTYDPFTTAFAARPQRRFDLITCFEVLEHSNRPAETLDEIVSLRNSDGLLLFSTLLVPPEIAKIGVSWWYIAPRNGHVTLYSAKSLRSLLAWRGLRMGSENDLIHYACAEIPAFAQHLRAG
jgi:2-polyprenyl-3-methyl-5-hydroxy-6-metoxy-1,4-benzoquinol methylase